MLKAESMCDELSGPEEPKVPAGEKLSRERVVTGTWTSSRAEETNTETGRLVESL